MTQRENAALRLQIKNLEKEINRKDGVIRQVITDAQPDFREDATPAENGPIRARVKQLESELAVKGEELANVKRSVKYTRIQELEL